jgi:tetratricopeptide (TPR) repeat protein
LAIPRPDHSSFSPETALKGAFSSQEKVRLGFGATSRAAASTLYWYVEQVGVGRYEARKLNTAHLPTDEVLRLDTEQFLTRFSPEIDLYNTKVRPAMAGLEEVIERGDRLRDEGRLYSAESAYDEALAVDENNVRATFGLGLTFLAREDLARAKEVFDRLVELDAAYEMRHKHMFNEFGIALRKSHLYDEALVYYFRGVELGCDDEHLLFNIARVCFEKNDWAGCAKYLTLCLETNQAVEDARKFCSFILAKTTRPEGRDIMDRAAARMNTDAAYLLARMRQAAHLSSEEAELRRDRLKPKLENAARRQRRILEQARAAGEAGEAAPPPPMEDLLASMEEALQVEDEGDLFPPPKFPGMAGLEPPPLSTPLPAPVGGETEQDRSMAEGLDLLPPAISPAIGPDGDRDRDRTDRTFGPAPSRKH